MRIQSIELHKFMVHDLYRLDLPEVGVTTITGPIGSGKSSFTEAIASIWNQCLRHDKSRRTRGFRKKTAGSVLITTKEVQIHRSQKSSGTLDLKFTLKGEAESTFTTPSKTQENLETHIGGFDRWRRSCLFSSANASAFSAATDGERREILEELLDLSIYVQAYEVAKKRRTELARGLEATRTNLTNAGTDLHMARQALEVASHNLSELSPPDPLPASESVEDMAAREKLLQERVDKSAQSQNWDRKRVEMETDCRRAEELYQKLQALDPVGVPGTEEIDKLRDDWHLLATEIKELDATEYRETAESMRDKIAGVSVRVEIAQGQLERLSNDVCPTCLQDVTAERRAQAGAEVEVQIEKADVDRARYTSMLDAAREEIDEINETLEGLKTEQDAAKLQGTELKAARATAERELRAQTKNRGDANLALGQARDKLQQLGDAPDTADRYDTVNDQLNVVRTARGQRQRLEAVYTEAIGGYRSSTRRWTASVDSHTEAVAKSTTKVADLQAEEAIAVVDLAVAEEGVKVLSPKGARATFLTQAIEAIEMVANSWLTIFHPKMRVRLSAYSETTKGVPKMEIRLEALGLAEGEDYFDMSTGERGCMNFALVLAMADVYRKAQGLTEDGTLWLDEILDNLCADTAARVCGAVNEIARTRAVVVISHKALILDLLQSVGQVKLGEVAS